MKDRAYHDTWTGVTEGPFMSHSASDGFIGAASCLRCHRRVEVLSDVFQYVDDPIIFDPQVGPVLLVHLCLPGGPTP